MSVTASEIFDFLERQNIGIIERYEIASPTFGTLRRSLRKIVLYLRDSEDQEALSISQRLQASLSEWLTVPTPFDHSMLISVEDSLGQTEDVKARWGADIGDLYGTALCAARELPSIENPVRKKLREVIWRMRTNGRTFKVYCHRQARPHFESLFTLLEDIPLSEDAFLHSVRDYRMTKPFDVLIKVGPLRTRGWGSAPDALLTAPRFRTLIQTVWSGCRDDPDFGYDPVSPPKEVTISDGTALSAILKIRRGPMDWKLEVTQSGEDLGAPVEYIGEADELRIFRTREQQNGKRNALLVQVDEDYGILFPPYSQILSFDPDPSASEPINLRTPNETLVDGMFLITPIVNPVNLGGTHAEHGDYSQIWRAKLEQELRTDAEGLIARLQAAGLKLVRLDLAIRHWCKPPSTVIHAPQQKRHFEILIRVLRVGNSDSNRQNLKPPLLFHQLAWNEVRRSRGEAIQTGVQEHEIVEEQLIVILRKLMPQIREKASSAAGFLLIIPEGNEMKGSFIFHKVDGIESGFSVPETELRTIHELNLLDQWRD